MPVPAPVVNSWILIALARAAAAFADSASRCRRCYRVFCALCTTAFEPVLVLYFWPFLWYWFGDPAFGPPAIDCEPCHEVWPVRVLYFWLLPRRFAHGPSPSGHAASTTFSGTGIPPSAQLSTLRRALLPLPRCLDALRILFSCCSMALFLVTPAMRPVMAWFQGAFFWLCRFWPAFCASDFALAGQPSRYLFLVPFAQRHSNGWR